MLDQLAETDAVDVLRAIIERAKQGDMTAAGMLMGRVWPQRRSRPVAFDLPLVSTAKPRRPGGSVPRAHCIV